MKLYVPEIGDHIRLTGEWKFELHPESRNTDLGAYFGHYLQRVKVAPEDYRHDSGIRWVEEAKLPMMREIDYKVDYPSDNEIRKRFGISPIHFHPSIFHEKKNAAWKEAEQACPEYVKYWKDNTNHMKEAGKIGTKELEVTLPAGTVLAIDRIYIRKGSSDYSSITFYAKELGEVLVRGRRWGRSEKPKKKKALRFWAKLSDCNQIEFETIETPKK